MRSSFNFSRRSAQRRRRPAADARRQRQRHVSDAADARLRRTAEPGRSAAHRPAVSAGPAVVVLERGHPRHARRAGRSDAGAGTSSANGQLAARRIGSEVGFVKSFFTAQAFRVVPGTSRVVFAGNARLGLATGFPRDAGRRRSERSSPASDSQPAAERAVLRRRRHDDARLRARSRSGTPGETLDDDLLPIGGNGLVIFNAELRAPVTRGLGVVGFLDTGNVFASASDIDLAKLRSAVGGGVRYKSPFGPIRFDLGFKVNR